MFYLVLLVSLLLEVLLQLLVLEHRVGVARDPVFDEVDVDSLGLEFFLLLSRPCLPLLLGFLL